MLLQIEADRPDVPHDLPRRLLECEIQTAFSASTGGIGEVRAKNSLARSGCAGQQNARAFVIAPGSQHIIEPLNAGGYRLVRSLMAKIRRRNGQDADAL